MALDLRVAVNKTIVDLRKEMSKKSSELMALREELARYEKVHDFLKGPSRAARTRSSRRTHRKPVDWNAVLKQLPGSFGLANVADLAKVKSRNYTHRFLAKWIRQRKIKRLKPGQYQKL